MRTIGCVPEIVVIVVNYGTADLTIRAVESVLRCGDGPAVKVHVVDNASPDEDAVYLEKKHTTQKWRAGVTLWLEAENHGFGRGNNIVLDALAKEESPPDAVMLLNPDARLENEAIDILYTALKADTGAAAVGAAILRPDGTSVSSAFRFPGAVNEVMRTVNLGILHRLFRKFLIPLPSGHPAGPVDWVSGAAVMFRWEALQQVGFFDPGFFLYYEEVDLMRRLRGAGWRILHVPQARVIHEEGAATGQFAGRVTLQRDPAYLYQSWTRYFSRAYGRAGALAIALVMWPAALLNIIHRGLRGKPPTLPKYFFSDHWRYVIWPLLSGKERG